MGAKKDGALVAVCELGRHAKESGVNERYATVSSFDREQGQGYKAEAKEHGELSPCPYRVRREHVADDDVKRNRDSHSATFISPPPRIPRARPTTSAPKKSAIGTKRWPLRKLSCLLATPRASHTRSVSMRRSSRGLAITGVQAFHLGHR